MNTEKAKNENPEQSTETPIQTSNDVIENSEQVQTSNEETTVSKTDETGHTELPTTIDNGSNETTEAVASEETPTPIFDAEVKETVEEVIERTPKKEVSWVVYLAILLLIVALIYVIRIAFYATEESN